MGQRALHRRKPPARKGDAKAQEEAHLRDFFENASIGLHWVGPDGTILWANKAELELLGYSKEEYIGQPISKFHVDGPVIDDILGRLTARETLRNYEARLRAKDGSIKHVLISSSVLVEDDQFVHTRCFTKDVTERKLSDDRVRRSEERFRAIFERSPFATEIFSAEGRSIRVNKAWQELWALPWTALERHYAEYNLFEDRQLTSGETGDCLRSAFAGTPSVAPAILYDPSAPGKPGRARWVEVYFYPVRLPSGSLDELIVIFDDVTEHRQAEENLRDAVRSRDEFLSICSHELKTPLTSMKLQFQMAARQMQRGDAEAFSPEAMRKRILDTNRQLDRMSKLIENMLDVSRISQGRLQLEREEVDLGGLVEEVVESLADQLRAHGCRPELRVAPGVVGRWDRFRLEQVVSNLLTNAMKYGSRRPIELSVAREGASAVLQVRDQGIGIARADLERIFQQFERAIPASSISGLGLGLYISRQIAEAHGGRVRVESEPGEGSSFRLELPLEQASPP